MRTPSSTAGRVMCDLYRVPCIFDRVSADKKLTVEVPGSKSITNRALLLATLAEGESRLLGVLFSEDSRHFLSCIQELGFETKVEEDRKQITVHGLGGRAPKEEASIYVGSAGTAARFLTAYLGIVKGSYHLDASPQMRRRPMAPLLACLEQMGCEILYWQEEGHFPFTLRGHGFGNRKLTVDIDSSSQFLSAVLISSVLSEDSLDIQVQGSHGMAYIDMTRRMMEQFGVDVLVPAQSGQTPEKAGEAGTCFQIPGSQHYRAREYRIEPDVSAACYFYGMAALLGITVTVKGVHFDSLQGDVEFLRILERMGCKVRESAEGIRLLGPAGGRLKGVEADLSACSDQAITLAALAPFADGPVRITGIGHIRLQESDRIHGIAAELGRMGIACEEGADCLTIWPGEPKGCVVETYEDHRMAMGFSLVGLRSPGIAIADPSCCKKTFEDYFAVLEDSIHRMLQFY